MTTQRSVSYLLEAGHGVPSNITRCASLWFLTLQGTRANRPFPQKKAHTTPAHANKRVCVRLSPATNLASTGRHPIIKHTMSLRLVEGASDGCRPKLHRWPFSVLSLHITVDFSVGFTSLSLERGTKIPYDGRVTAEDAYTVRAYPTPLRNVAGVYSDGQHSCQALI